MRERLSQTLQLGETLSFHTKIDCTAAAFRLVDGSIGASLVVESSTSAMLYKLSRHPMVAVDNPALSPDQIMIEAANDERAQGMAMRRSALEGRACMDERVSAEFGRLLGTPGAVFVFDQATASVMLIDQVHRVLVVARGGA